MNECDNVLVDDQCLNTRIKLHAQEWLGYDPEKGNLHGYTFEQMEEFAQLIVRECMDYASRNWEHGHLLAQDLKTHFGVEE